MFKYTAFTLLACPLFLHAQPQIAHLAQHPGKHTFQPASALGPSGEQAMDLALRSAAATVWSEDFESGWNGWSVNTVNGPVDWQLTSTGNTGGFTPGPLQSTTGYPTGTWAVADSDLHGVPGVQEDTELRSPPILGLDTLPYLLLRFEQCFRQLNGDDTDVEVSGDGGQSWTIFPVNRSIPGNQSTAGAPQSETVLLNISSALNGGASDIRIRFRWRSIQGYAYSWQVDDIALVVPADNDLRILSATYAERDPNDPHFKDLPYSIYPINEVRPLTMKVVVMNNGSQDQHDIGLTVDIDGPGPNDVTLNSPVNITSLAPGAMDSLIINGYVPIAVEGPYALQFSVGQVESEDEPDDNIRSLGFAIDEFIFARDRDSMDGDYDNEGDPYELGNWFHITDYDNVLYGIDVALSSRTDPGAVIRATLYDETRTYVMETVEHTVSAADLNTLGQSKFLHLPLLTPVPLDDDTDYLVTVSHFGGPLEVYTATSGTSEPQSSLILDGSNSTWYYVTSTPMVRMNFDATVGMNEQVKGLGQLIAAPSVFDESTLITIDLPQAQELSWSLTDMHGREIAHGRLGYRSEGRLQVRLDGADIADGVYLFTAHGTMGRSSLRIVKAGNN
ncbi:MAG: hypothetical protein KDB88_00665 [Flavobacteriales bacterium]|nr:hypothetical protein [Flavobacteriales bacterium]